MASVGEKLRAARLDQGLELAELSARTKISAKFLAALENDDRQSIPGGFFYRNWVQQYARALSLDSAPIIAEIDRIFINEQAPPLPGQTSGSLSEIKPAPINLEHRSGGGRRHSGMDRVRNRGGAGLWADAAQGRQDLDSAHHHGRVEGP